MILSLPGQDRKINMPTKLIIAFTIMTTISTDLDCASLGSKDNNIQPTDQQGTQSCDLHRDSECESALILLKTAIKSLPAFLYLCLKIPFPPITRNPVIGRLSLHWLSYVPLLLSSLMISFSFHFQVTALCVCVFHFHTFFFFFQNEFSFP